MSDRANLAIASGAIGFVAGVSTTTLVVSFALNQPTPPVTTQSDVTEPVKTDSCQEDVGLSFEVCPVTPAPEEK